mgnify:CR=1 FL=1
MNGYLFRDLYAKSNNDIVAELGKRFRDYRIALRLTQKEVADLLGISQSYISRLEKKIMQRLKREMVRFEI